MITVRRPDEQRLRTLHAEEMKAQLTYPEHGATRSRMPAAYAHDYLRGPLGHGHDTFDRAVDHLFDWNMHKGAGIDVSSPEGRAAAGVTVLLTIGFGPVLFVASARVIYVVDEPDCKGFAYGTLPEHPEVGEEWFGVTIDETGQVHLEVWAFSRPGLLIAKIGRPVTRLVQKRTGRRYLRSVQEAAKPIGR